MSTDAAAPASQEPMIIIGRVGMSVLMFKTVNSFPPYSVLPGTKIFSLSNFLCFTGHAPGTFHTSETQITKKFETIKKTISSLKSEIDFFFQAKITSQYNQDTKNYLGKLQAAVTNHLEAEKQLEINKYLTEITKNANLTIENKSGIQFSPSIIIKGTNEFYEYLECIVTGLANFSSAISNTNGKTITITLPGKDNVIYIGAGSDYSFAALKLGEQKIIFHTAASSINNHMQQVQNMLSL